MTLTGNGRYFLESISLESTGVLRHLKGAPLFLFFSQIMTFLKKMAGNEYVGFSNAT